MTAPATTANSLSASITVNDVHASMAWFRDVFGFTVAQEMSHEGKLRGVAMSAGSVRILLNQDNFAKGKDRDKGQGISLMLTTSQPVDEIAARIRANGGTLDTEPADMPWGARVFRVTDPDGFHWAVSSERNG